MVELWELFSRREFQPECSPQCERSNFAIISRCVDNGYAFIMYLDYPGGMSRYYMAVEAVDKKPIFRFFRSS